MEQSPHCIQLNLTWLTRVNMYALRKYFSQIYNLAAHKQWFGGLPTSTVSNPYLCDWQPLSLLSKQKIERGTRLSAYFLAIVFTRGRLYPFSYSSSSNPPCQHLTLFSHDARHKFKICPQFSRNMQVDGHLLTRLHLSYRKNN